MKSGPYIFAGGSTGLLALGIQHTIFSGVSVEIGRVAADRIHRAIDPVIEGMADWVQNEPDPAKRMIVDCRSCSWRGIDQRRAIQNVVDACRGSVFPIVGTCALLARRAATAGDESHYQDADSC